MQITSFLGCHLSIWIYLLQKDGFDLDLTYVTENVIAMSFPSSGSTAIYRNPIGEVARFFKKNHRGKFRIYNLCSKYSSDYLFLYSKSEPGTNYLFLFQDIIWGIYSHYHLLTNLKVILVICTPTAEVIELYSEHRRNSPKAFLIQ